MSKRRKLDQIEAAAMAKSSNEDFELKFQVWLESLGYQNDESLRKLQLHGAISKEIWTMLMEHVKPKQTVRHCKRFILLRELEKRNYNLFSISNTVESVDELDAYEDHLKFKKAFKKQRQATSIQSDQIKDSVNKVVEYARMKKCAELVSNKIEFLEWFKGERAITSSNLRQSCSLFDLNDAETQLPDYDACYEAVMQAWQNDDVEECAIALDKFRTLANSASRWDYLVNSLQAVKLSLRAIEEKFRDEAVEKDLVRNIMMMKKMDLKCLQTKSFNKLSDVEEYKRLLIMRSSSDYQETRKAVSIYNDDGGGMRRKLSKLADVKKKILTSSSPSELRVVCESSEAAGNDFYSYIDKFVENVQLSRELLATIPLEAYNRDEERISVDEIERYNRKFFVTLLFQEINENLAMKRVASLEIKERLEKLRKDISNIKERECRDEKMDEIFASFDADCKPVEKSLKTWKYLPFNKWIPEEVEKDGISWCYYKNICGKYLFRSNKTPSS